MACQPLFDACGYGWIISHFCLIGRSAVDIIAVVPGVVELCLNFDVLYFALLHFTVLRSVVLHRRRVASLLCGIIALLHLCGVSFFAVLYLALLHCDVLGDLLCCILLCCILSRFLFCCVTPTCIYIYIYIYV